MTTYPLGLYVGNPNGNDPAANEIFLNAFDAFKTVMGVSPLFMNTFVDFGQDPSQWISNAGWSAWSWAKTGSGYVGPGSGVIPVIGVPLASNADGWGNADTFYKSIMSGTLDAPYKSIVTSWASQGYSTLQLRLGYEFNGNFMPWSPGNSVSPTANADFVAAWQHVATLVHDQGAESGITVQIIWNPADINWTTTPPAQLYRDDACVDIIGTDTYSPVYPLNGQLARRLKIAILPLGLPIRPTGLTIGSIPMHRSMHLRETAMAGLFKTPSILRLPIISRSQFPRPAPAITATRLALSTTQRFRNGLRTPWHKLKREASSSRTSIFGRLTKMMAIGAS